MRLTDRLPMDDEFDRELAIECGFTDEQLDGDRFELPLSQFVYVQDQWECESCQVTEWHTEGPRYYYNAETNQYDAPKPLTLKERAALERQAQEAAGQLKLFDEAQS